ncbi:UNVERIFIED_CONTAM: Receptor kinase-like protein Xa21 [Sesamum radiatum]|uniref:Receptor kinase-like protein Xa21 n=1 Tax=Sesamum radiatum TaxID=300843 RepID=A0AAW2LA90_SESRA
MRASHDQICQRRTNVRCPKLRSIPEEIGNAPVLQVLSLRQNSLVGTIPPSLGNVSNLEMIDLGVNNFQGSIPTELGHLSNLQQLYLSFDNLSGEIPMSIFNISTLQILALTGNSLSGSLPTDMAVRLPNLQGVFGSNQLTGQFPALFQMDQYLAQPVGFSWKVSCLRFWLKGVIPTEIGNLTNLYWLSLAENNLTGEFPDTIGNLRNLRRFRAYDNGIQGGIPSGLCNLEGLYELNLGKNKLSGELPSCLGNISSLREIYLDSNALASSLPSSFWGNKDLLVVNLSSNFLYGALGQEIGSVAALRELYLGWNNFSGEIPTSIGGLQELVNLSLSMNMLDGSIPEKFGDLISLEYLDLSHNNISGIIPMSMEKLSHLVYLNLSFNELSGEIPNGGPFQNFTAASFIGNNALCGASRFNVMACKTIESRKPRRNRESRIQIESGIVLRQRISYVEILQATEDFAAANLLGSGSFGKVYKGMFLDGAVAAIKVFNLDVQDAIKSFDRECEAMRNIRHRNLVKVISSCSNADFKAIIFDYMPTEALRSGYTLKIVVWT